MLFTEKFRECLCLFKTKGEKVMKIAIPTAGGKLCMHFGHCEEFLFLDVDVKEKKILNRNKITPPPH